MAFTGISLILLILSYYQFGFIALPIGLFLISTINIKLNRDIRLLFVFLLMSLILLMRNEDYYDIGSKIYIEGYISKAYENYENFQRVEVKDRLSGNKFSLETKGKYQLKENDKVMGTIKIIPTKSYRNFGAFNREDYYFNNYISNSAKEVDLVFYPTLNPIFIFKDNLINSLKDSIEKNFKADNREIVSRLIIGTSIENELISEAYSKGGLSHLLAVSGLHISILSFMLTYFLTKLKLPFNLRYTIAGIFLIFYSFILGFPPSAMRSILMAFITIISQSINIKLSNKNIIFLSMIILLFINPRYIFNIGFQLSYGAVFGLTYFYDKFNFLNDNILENALKTYLSANILIFPLCVYYFNNYNVISFFANLIITPVFSIFLPLAIIGLLLDLLSINIYPLFIFLNLLLDFSNFFLMNLLGNFGIQTRLFNPNIAFILFYYLIILLIFNTDFNRFLFQYRKSFLLISFFFIVINFSKKDDNLYLGFYDVGQGDSCYIYYKDFYMQIDTGGNSFGYFNPGKEITGKLIEKRGILVDILLLSHFDSDHVLGTEYLLENNYVKSLIINSKREGEVFDYIKESNIDYYTPRKGDYIKVDENLSIYFYNTDYNMDSNDSSLVVLLNYKDYKILYTGDISSKIEEQLLYLGPIDILKVSHHGSKHSTNEKFAKAMAPKYSIISVGTNSYGHPSQEVLDNLSFSKILRTDIEGEIIFTINDEIDYLSYNDRKDIEGLEIFYNILIGILLGITITEGKTNELWRI